MSQRLTLPRPVEHGDAAGESRVTETDPVRKCCGCTEAGERPPEQTWPSPGRDSGCPKSSPRDSDIWLRPGPSWLAWRGRLRHRRRCPSTAGDAWLGSRRRSDRWREKGCAFVLIGHGYLVALVPLVDVSLDELIGAKACRLPKTAWKPHRFVVWILGVPVFPLPV